MAASMEHVENIPVLSEDPPQTQQPVPEETEPAQPAPAPNEQDEDEGDEEDEPVSPREPRIRDTPEDIRLEASANALSFHPSRDLVAIGDLDGDIYAYTYSCTEGENKEVWSSGHHLKSCRALSFSQDGQKLFSVSKDKSIHILDVETGKLVTRVPKAHTVSLYSLLLVDENILATGDEEGTLKVWDMRKGSSFMDMKHHEDYISGMAIDQAKKTLLTSSGDGTMGVFNIKRRRFELVSEYQSGDLTCVSLMKRGRKVVCGSSEGTVYIFNWDGFGATSDRFALKAETVDCIVPITDSILCAGSTDGVIRAINILPNRVIGSIGQHVGEPVEQIVKSADGRFLASCAHDQLVKFWDISSLAAMTVSDYRKRKKKDGRLKALSKKAHGTDDFFSGLIEPEKGDEEGGGDEEEEEQSDSDSDSD